MKVSVLLFAFLPLISIGQTYSSIVSDSAILSFMEWEVKNGKKYREGGKLRITKKARIKIKKYDTTDFILPDSIDWRDWQYDFCLFNRNNELDSIFSDAEKDALFIQYTSILDTVWTHKIKGARWRKWKNPKNTYSYALPLFSSNGQYVLIRKSFYCGNLCAYGGVYLYRKTEDESWELIKIMNGWIS